MTKFKRNRTFFGSHFYLFFLIISFFSINSCSRNVNEKTQNNYTESRTETISKNEFINVPDDSKPWVYYWWLKGNVTKELITRDLEEMKDKGIGGFLLFDSRRYWDSYDGRTGHIPVPLHIKHEFMSPGWREMVKYTMQEANRLGLKMSINLADTGGSLRGPWDMKEDRPKQLIWTASTVSGPTKLAVKLEIPSDQKYFQDVALMAVHIKSKGRHVKKTENLNHGWKTVSAPEGNAPIAGEIIKLENKVNNGILQWDVPEGEWQILRFGYHIIGEEGSVDILNPDAVTKYFNLMGAELIKDAGPLAGVTLTHFYNVSWEGGEPDWTENFINDFKKFRGYDIQKYMPVLTGMSVGNLQVNNRFLSDYLKTVSDCFKHNCYETIGKLCHAKGIKWHSEDGGPWARKAPMFREADQLTFWGRNDMPQGEFWCSNLKDLQTKTNMRYTAMAGHIYGHPLIAVEAFTHMGLHWTKYPAYLKPFADVNLIDGANFFIWHTFTASPLEIGKPGYEYFAGTHINPNITWWNEASGIFDYLGRCQYMLRKGNFVSDICCYVNDKNYLRWGRGEKWNENSELSPVKGYTYDLLSSEVLVNSLSVKDGKLILPDGMNYKMLVVDLDEAVIPIDVLKKITELAKEGATIVLGETKPLNVPGIKNYPEVDKEVKNIVSELWANTSEKMHAHQLGKGKIYSGTDMEEILKDNKLLPDFDGPFEYIHRAGNSLDIYFVSGEGKTECTFRVKDKKPEIWDPVTGQTKEAVYYNSTADGRTKVLLDLHENGSAFVVFKEEIEKNHLISFDGPQTPEILTNDDGTSNAVFWENGNYNFTKSNGKSGELTVTEVSSTNISGTWDVTFVPATDVGQFKSTFNKLTLWNKNQNPDIKYFSGTAAYTNSFSITAEQTESPALLQLGEVHDIAHVWVNGKDMGIVWTSPWSVDITGALKDGANNINIEVTNCWANRLIGDARLPENEWTTKTNVRRVPDRSKYNRHHQAFSAADELMPSGLVGPVLIGFGQVKESIIRK